MGVMSLTVTSCSVRGKGWGGGRALGLRTRNDIAGHSSIVAQTTARAGRRGVQPGGVNEVQARAGAVSVRILRSITWISRGIKRVIIQQGRGRGPGHARRGAQARHACVAHGQRHARARRRAGAGAAQALKSRARSATAGWQGAIKKGARRRRSRRSSRRRSIRRLRRAAHRWWRSGRPRP